MDKNLIKTSRNHKGEDKIRNIPLDSLFKALTLTASFAVIVLLAFIIFKLYMQSTLSMDKFGWRFITSMEWDPVQGEFGAGAYIYGTIVSSLIALLIATPVSVGIALYLTEIAPPWLSTPVGFLVELLAAIPSVIYGLWGIFVFVPFIRQYIQKPLGDMLGWIPLFSGPPLGIGMLSAGVILAIMIIPIITSISRDIISSVPTLQREGALALGATKWEVIKYAILPYAKSGILGGIILGLGRALGETMAVTMVIGNRPEIKASLFAPAHSMAAVIANEFTEATDDIYLSALIEIGLLLFLVTFVMNGLARFFIWSVARGPKGGIRQ
ncbi:MAG: phosphate ABC transporter permease subunit PstC [Bacillota bacterium]